MAEKYICPGCLVRGVWEHRCCRDDENGKMCECKECRALERLQKDKKLAG